MRGMAAFILAGGVGKRLSLLTSHRAKPAVPFAGKYRIIDFTLTNCVRSDITVVHVLTQYISRSLIRHLGIGKPWDLDRLKNGLHILHPRLGYEGADWYRGTADAMYQNISVLKKLQNEYILILSGDHVYNMDYREFLDFHIGAGKPASLAVTDVPPKMCREFGIATVDRNGRITGFEEKPLKTESTLASMGIYIFDRKFLVSVLEGLKQDFQDLDFGKHIIPELVLRGRISAFRYSGYWLDIGTLKSYYRASLALLASRPLLDIDNRDMSVLTVPYDNPPTMISAGSNVRNSLICNGCHISGSVVNSILSPGVTIEEGSMVEDSIILHGCRVKKGAIVKGSIIDKMSVIGRSCTIGEGNSSTPNRMQPDLLDFGLTLVGRKTIIPGGTRIGTNCLVSGSARNGRIPGGDLEDGESHLASDVAI